MMLNRPGGALAPGNPPDPVPGPGQVLLSVRACGVCRTDLHILDGELRPPRHPLIPGHQIVGRVVALGASAGRYRPGARVGVPWLGWTCGTCRFCRSGLENLCDQARFTGFHLDGGFATLAAADERFCFAIPEGLTDEEAAPLLCGGLIGYRALRLAGDPQRLGLYGFGSAAHMLLQLARYEGRQVLAFTRPGDRAAADFARSLAAAWAGDSDQQPPEPLDAALIFAPVGALVPAALRAVRKGGTVVCAGIHMSDIPPLAYADLWNERVLRSVANLTRKDGEEFLALAARVPVRTTVRTLPLASANEALAALRAGEVQGSLVLTMA